MPQIKKTKIELKAQRDALRRFERFLPMLQLKKQQLQMELQGILAAMDKHQVEEQALLNGARPWAALFADGDVLAGLMPEVDRLVVSDANIAGVTIPVFESIHFRTPEANLFSTPPWVDEALDLIMKLASNRIRRDILQKQIDLLEEELRTTSQRVNLFEKVKIPESREKIRVIRIFLGDQMTAEVARGKAAKKISSRRREATP
jgi:V/A-type H+-transporting ATPase subunit D